MKKNATKNQPAELTTRATVRSGGKQYTVSAGQRILVDKISGAPGDSIELTEVLALFPGEGEPALIGAPTVEGARINAKIVKLLRGPKLVAFKKKRRKGYKRKVGHRQSLAEIEIEGISASR